MDEKNRYFLTKDERLCSRRAFEYLFEHGTSVRVGVLKFFFTFDMPADWVSTPLTVAFSAPKRNFKKAVTRNYLKRRMREAYRLHKHLLIPDLQRKERNLVLLIKYQARYPGDYHQIEQATIRGFRRLSTQLNTLS